MKLAALGLLLTTSACSHDSQLWSEYEENSGQAGLLEQVLQDFIEKSELHDKNIVVSEYYFLMGFTKLNDAEGVPIDMEKGAEERIESTLAISRGQESRIEEAVRDFCQKNMKEGLGPLLTEEEISFPLLTGGISDSGEAFWKKLNQRFPLAKQMVYLSQPGFSADGKTAMVYLATYMPGNAASGKTYLYRHLRGSWKQTHDDLGPSWRRK